MFFHSYARTYLTFRTRIANWLTWAEGKLLPVKRNLHVRVFKRGLLLIYDNRVLRLIGIELRNGVYDDTLQVTGFEPNTQRGRDLAREGRTALAVRDKFADYFVNNNPHPGKTIVFINRTIKSLT
jgi:hypothetical protein